MVHEVIVHVHFPDAQLTYQIFILHLANVPLQYPMKHQ